MPILYPNVMQGSHGSEKVQKFHKNTEKVQKFVKYQKSTEIGHLVQKKYRNLPFSAAKSTEIRQFNDIF